MYHPIVLPAFIHYYPFGNTRPVYLFQDLAPEDRADVLLLGCGDPRHILFSLSIRKNASIQAPIDITCCDVEPAILARNAMLFTLLIDHEAGEAQHKLWNIMFNVYIDEESHNLIIGRCKALVEFSESLEKWSQSPYASVLSFCSQDTLEKMRRMWSIWATSATMSPQEQKKKITGSRKRDKKNFPVSF